MNVYILLSKIESSHKTRQQLLFLMVFLMVPPPSIDGLSDLSDGLTYGPRSFCWSMVFLMVPRPSIDGLSDLSDGLTYGTRFF